MRPLIRILLLALAVLVPAITSTASPSYAETRVWGFELEEPARARVQSTLSQTCIEGYRSAYDGFVVGCPPVPRGQAWFDEVAANATRNSGSDRLVLGHFSREGASYQNFAAHYNATYFKIKDWRAVTRGLSQDEIWKINETFLTQQLRQGKQVLFSHDPLKARAGSFFEKEVNFLKELGYSFRRKNQWTWEAVR